ncbi:MAG: saccharopine dehydrogenase family protein [Candidatus Geothermincolia bacterium]
MNRITVFGGCGQVGRVAVKALTTTDVFDEIVIADGQLELAERLAKELGPRVSAVRVDADDPASLNAAMQGSRVALSCIGPFYKYGPLVLKAAIEAGIDYVDISDDLDATQNQLQLDDAAKAAGISAIIGMGNSPGLANLMARFCADHWLDQAESVDIYHIHGGEPQEGPAVIKHRLHAMTNDIPIYEDGEFIMVRMLEESGLPYWEETDFARVGTYPVYPYPHPETITLPRHLKGVKHVTNKGSVLPKDYFDLTMQLVRDGLAWEEPVTVQGNPVIPLEFAVSYILARRPEYLAAAGVTQPTGCLKVKVSGLKDGQRHTYIASMISESGQAAGEGTGIPAALGAMWLAQGKVAAKGVLPPEAAIDLAELLGLAGEVIKHFGMGGGVPLIVEHIDPSGKSESMDIQL